MTNFTTSIRRRKSWKGRTQFIGGLLAFGGLVLIWVYVGLWPALGAFVLIWGNNLQQAANRGEFGP